MRGSTTPSPKKRARGGTVDVTRAGLLIDYRIGSSYYVPTHPELKTDKDGRFRAEGLVPGQDYILWLPRVQRVLVNAVVEPGKHKDLGDLKTQLDQ